MNPIGQKVHHKKYGEGKIKELSDTGNIEVEFAGATLLFKYPDVFEKFLTASDAAFQKETDKLIKSKKEKEELEKAAKREADEKKRTIISSSDKEYQDKKISTVKRNEGQAMTFISFMGEFYEPELKMGIIWAPIYDVSGNTLFHWDNLLKVREGDIIIHSSDGYVRAVSRAKGACEDYRCPIHKEEWGQLYWDGRKVDCDYTVLEKPISISDFTEENIKYSQIKYAPFDKNGDPNSGYLYDLDVKLASIYLKAVVSNNPNVTDLEYIQWLLKQ